MCVETAGQDLASAVNSFAFQPIETMDAVFVALADGNSERAAILVDLRRAIKGEIDADPVVDRVIQHAAQTPYFDLADYMGRNWFFPKTEGAPYMARVHQVMRSDHDRALHDHPWANASFVLRGGYWEVMPGRFQMGIEQAHYGRCAGPLRFDGEQDAARAADEALKLNALIQVHSAAALPGDVVTRLRQLGVEWRAPLSFTARGAESLHRLVVPQGTTAWSLFTMRPKYRDWGFYTVDGWVHNEPYLADLGRAA